MDENSVLESALMAELESRFSDKANALHSELRQSNQFWKLLLATPKLLDEQSQFVENYVWKIPLILSNQNIRYVDKSLPKKIFSAENPIYTRQFHETIEVSSSLEDYRSDSTPQITLFNKICSASNSLMNHDGLAANILDELCENSSYFPQTLLLNKRLLGYIEKPESTQNGETSSHPSSKRKNLQNSHSDRNSDG